MGSGLEVGRYGGGAALKAGQPWVPAAELSLWEVGGCCLTCQVGTNRACSIPPSVSQEDSVDHDNSPVISARSLGSCQTVTSGLRSEALTTPTSLAPSHTPHPHLRACLLGRGGRRGENRRAGAPHPRGPPGRPGPLCSDMDLCVTRKRASRLRTRGWKSDTPGAASCYPLGPHDLHPQKRMLRLRSCDIPSHSSAVTPCVSKPQLSLPPKLGATQAVK